MSAANRMTWMSVLAVAGVLAAWPAEARFGKRSNPDSSSDSGSSKKEKKRSSSSDEHEATAVGEEPTYQSSSSPSTRSYSSGYSDYRPRYYGWGFAYQPFYGHQTYVQTSPTPEPGSRSDVKTSVSGGLMVFGAAAGGGGAALDIGLMFEGERLGFTGTFSGLGISADDGSGGTDSIKLLNGFITYSLISAPEGRLRLEGGVMTAFAPDLIVMGPAGGLSAAMGVVGPIGVDGSIRMTMFPYRQVDAQAGLTLGLGHLGLRAGMRGIYLDDAGLVDGIVHTDAFVGPYGGLELVF